MLRCSVVRESSVQAGGAECGASITWMAAGEASVCICSLLGLGMVRVLDEHFGWTR
jgi:hypothetical protein